MDAGDWAKNAHTVFRKTTLYVNICRSPSLLSPKITQPSFLPACWQSLVRKAKPLKLDKKNPVWNESGWQIPICFLLDQFSIFSRVPKKNRLGVRVRVTKCLMMVMIMMMVMIYDQDHHHHHHVLRLGVRVTKCLSGFLLHTPLQSNQQVARFNHHHIKIIIKIIVS